MRPKTLEISWHETQAVYSCDFQPLPVAQLKRLLPTSDDDEAGKKDDRVPVVAGGRQYRFATAGGDSKVRLWMIHPNIPPVSASAHAAVTGQEIVPHPPRAEYLATLSKHTAAVNVVRFSPNGQTLASAGDDGNVILWVQSERPVATFGESSDDSPEKEHWRLQKMLQVTTKHVYDLAWSPDGEFFIAGSTDNTATIWKAVTGECVFALREHLHNVQGVSWDPLNEYIATQSSDRSVHVNSFAFRNGVPDVHPVSRVTRMEIRHSRTPSFPSGPRPTMVRRGSTTSETGSVITSASEHTDLPNLNHHAAAPMTPSTSVPSTPQPASMNPPASTKPGSRRSSFSGSQAAASPALSAAPFPGRGRSPSPIPPLPAIRAPPISSQAIMQRLYGEEGVTRFFRRLTFSPDGSLLMTPAGQIEDQLFRGSPMLSARSLSQDGSDPTVQPPSSVPKPKNVDTGKPTVFIYGRANLARAPIAHLPGHKTASVAIRFSPIFYDLRTGATGVSAEPKHVTLDRTGEGPVHVSLSMPPPPPRSKDKEKEKEKDDKDKPLGSVFALPYRLLYAVACQDSVLLYDTQQAGPIAIFKGLHYAGFTDVAWSPDGQALMLSSADGYCSIVVFDMAELGTVHPTQQHHCQLAAIAQSHSHSQTTSRERDRENSSSVAGAHIPTHRESLASTPVPHSPAFSTMRQSPAPARSEREGSTSSSVATFSLPPQSMTLPLFTPNVGHTYPPSSSSSDPVPPMPGVEEEGFGFRRESGSESSSVPPSVPASACGGTGTGGVGLGLTQSGEELKRPMIEREEGGTKKKRRVALTQLGSEEA